MKNVPKLRFSGFSDEWEEKKLGDFLEFYSTNSLSRDCLNYESGKIRNIHYGDIHMNFPTIVDAKKEIIPFINEDIDTSKIKEDSYCKDGDLIIADASEDYNDIGKAIEIENIDHDKVLAGLHTILARDTKGVTAKRFKGYLLLNDAVRKQIKILAAGAKVLGISKTNLVKVTVKLPSKEEQEKIANFLTKVDKLIEKQDEKVSNLEQYKKGIMQKIFSQEVRFKNDDGGEYPEWEKKHLGNLVERVVRKNKGNVTKRPLTISAQYGLVDQEEFFNKVVASANLEGYYLLNKGEFAYNKSYSNGYPFGAIKRLDRYENGAVSTLYICFIPKEDVDSNYLVQYFESDMWHKEVSMIAVEGARNHGLLNISVTDFFETIHRIPCLEEQSKIANFLSKIDLVVEKEKEMLEELRKWKKGLLQQMFV